MSGSVQWRRFTFFDKQSVCDAGGLDAGPFPTALAPSRGPRL